MIYRENFRGAAERPAGQERLRFGSHGMAALLAITAIVLAAAIFLILNSALAMREAAQASPDQFPQAIAAVQQRFTGEVDDPLVEVSTDVFVRQSNLMGIEVDGVRYYYAILGHQSFDPVSRGEVAPEQIEIIYRSEGVGFPLIIYYISAQ